MAKDNPRARRLGEQIQRELGDLLRRDVKDGRIGNVTVTAVNVTGDLRTARVYYLIFGKDGPDPKVQRGLESAANFLRNALSKSLMIRYTPTLSFELDTSIEHGVRLTQLIDSVTKAEREAGGEKPGDEANLAAEANPAAGANPAGAAGEHPQDDDEHDHVIDEG
jgi:ribosome-binding factor A